MRFVLPVVLFVISALCVVISVGMGVSTWSFMASATSTQGTVIENIEEATEDGKTAYRPRYEYTDAAGERHEFAAEWTSSPPAYEVGESIAVSYAPDDPARHEVGGFVSRYIGAMAFAWTAVGLFFIARACYRSRKAEKPDRAAFWKKVGKEFLKAYGEDESGENESGEADEVPKRRAA